MPRLLLLRHAKSDWSNLDQDDHDRPLAPRGMKAAPLMGRYIGKTHPPIDLALVSTARRAQETWEAAAPKLRQDVPMRSLGSLYLAAPSRLLSIVQRQPAAVRTLLIIGHNPGMEGFAIRLATKGAHDSLIRMTEKFPTAALAAIDLPGEDWRSVELGEGRLVDFVVPRNLR